MTTAATFRSSARSDHLAGSNLVGSLLTRDDGGPNLDVALLSGDEAGCNGVRELPTGDCDCVFWKPGDAMQDERDDTTVTSSDDDAIAAVIRRAALASPALILIWSANEPERVGESIVLEGERPWVLGRDAAAPNAQLLAPRAPGRARAGKPLAGESISRRQLEVDYGDGGRLFVKAVGKGPVRVNGTSVARDASHPIAKGDVVTIGGAYALLVGERPSELRMQLPYPATHAFGDADALGLVGESAAMWALRDRLAAAADARTHVLVLGETGAGKELAARAIHALSDRARKPYVARNAATMPDGIFDAELFGCLKNYPNAGSEERKGLLGEADGGTLVFDEIGTIPVALQAKLLTFLDAGSYYRLGEPRERRADVRVIGATNSKVADLKNDLGPRFKVKVTVPSLAERGEDIPLLARHLVLKIADQSQRARRFVTEMNGRRDVRMSCAFVMWLVQRDYAGNTRELEEMLREAMLASEGDTIERTVVSEATMAPAQVDDGSDALSEIALRRALKDCGGNQSRAAEMLGVTRDKVRWAMKKYEIR